MISLHKLPKALEKSTRRVGRGGGSGRGKTAGRGTKGQKARGSIPAWFEGGQLPLIKRLPLYRGKSRNKSIKLKQLVINLKMLAAFPESIEVTKETLVKHHVLGKNALDFPVKILGDGEITKALTFKLPVSKSAKAKIEKAGGKVEN